MSCAVLFEISNLLNTGLDKQTLAILVELIGLFVACSNADRGRNLKGGETLEETVLW